MKLGSVAVAYKEERFIGPHIRHIPSFIKPNLVLMSSIPWFGKPEKADTTEKNAKAEKAIIVKNYWQTEHAQRNTGQALNEGNDWVIVLDPDEFLDHEGWSRLLTFLRDDADQDAYVCERQHTYWKDGWEADPPEDYRQIIAARPHVRFVDKRVINTAFGVAPVTLHHFSWARTDEEVKRKLDHYSEQHFDGDWWFKNVWLPWSPGVNDVHPSTPKALHSFKKAVLPPEIEELNLWP